MIEEASSFLVQLIVIKIRVPCVVYIIWHVNEVKSFIMVLFTQMWCQFPCVMYLLLIYYSSDYKWLMFFILCVLLLIFIFFYLKVKLQCSHPPVSLSVNAANAAARRQPHPHAPSYSAQGLGFVYYTYIIMIKES